MNRRSVLAVMGTVFGGGCLEMEKDYDGCIGVGEVRGVSASRLHVAEKPEDVAFVDTEKVLRNEVLETAVTRLHSDEDTEEAHIDRDDFSEEALHEASCLLVELGESTNVVIIEYNDELIRFVSIGDD